MKAASSGIITCYLLFCRASPTMMPTTSSRPSPVESTTTASAAFPLCAASSWSTRADQDRRDRLDAAQSGKAADAVDVDSTGLDLNGVVGVIVGLVPKSLQKSR